MYLVLIRFCAIYIISSTVFFVTPSVIKTSLPGVFLEQKKGSKGTKQKRGRIGG